MRITVKGLTELRARVAGMIGRLDNFQPGLMRAAMVVLKAAKQHISVGGPGWTPNLSGTPLLQRTGRLINSLALGASDNEADYSAMSVRVGTNVPYATWLQNGTGIYGPSGKPITATNGKALVFSSGGNVFVRRSIKGTPKRPFLYIDDPIAANVVSVWQNFIVNGLPTGGADA